MPSEEKEWKISVPSKGGEPKDKDKKENEKKKPLTPEELKKVQDDKKAKAKEEEMTEEDLKKKRDLELLVERVQDSDAGVQRLAVETMRSEIKSSTSSMTSVPKPLKFLRPHYGTMKDFYAAMPVSENKTLLADVLSVLAMTMASDGSNESLRFKLEATQDSLGSWGHEYVRNLSGEISLEYHSRLEKNEDYSELIRLVDDIVPFFMNHNAEPEACDLLLEMDRLSTIVDMVKETSCSRVCLYLTSVSTYLPAPEDTEVLKIAISIYRRLKNYPAAMNTAMILNNLDLVKEVFDEAEDMSVKKQLAFMIAKQQLNVEPDDEDLSLIVNNHRLSEYYLNLARDLDVMEPKAPEDIYKTHLQTGRSALAPNVESAKQNLAKAFVNAFVNAGFGNDKLIIKDKMFLYQNKEHGLISTAASLGLLYLWDHEMGLNPIDQLLYSEDKYIKCGSLMAIGLLFSNIKNECDPPLALLNEYVEDTNEPLMRIGSIFGLGVAYAGTSKGEVLDLLTPVVSDNAVSFDICGLAALSLGLVFVGSANEEVTQTITVALIERSEATDDGLTVRQGRFLALGLGLLFLGRKDLCETTLEAMRVLKGPFAKYCALTVETCAYAGSGDVLKIQEMLHTCTDPAAITKKDEKKEDEKEGGEGVAEKKDDKKDEKDAEDSEDKERMDHHAVAVLGIAMISMGEDIGSEMAARTFDHLLQYGDISVRRAVPLALGLLCVSNPKLTVTDTLIKLSHDMNPELAQNAILALGLVSAGTNNARVAHGLRQLASYYHKDAAHLFMVRIAQGLLHLGKGLLSVSPVHTERSLLNHVALGGLLAVLHSSLDMKNTILGQSHYLLYYLTCAMGPRMLVTVDEELNPCPVSVRIGQAVDVVGQAGKPKSITGFQTHTTPVLLGHGDRAEMATDEYEAVGAVLEGFVVLKKVDPEAKKK